MNIIRSYDFRPRKTEVPPEVHETRDAQRLKESCQQFESILWAQVWKKMKTTARSFSGEEQARPWKQMEDLSVEMASEEISKSGGAGLWKVLYGQMVTQLADQMKAEELAGDSGD